MDGCNCEWRESSEGLEDGEEDRVVRGLENGEERENGCDGGKGVVNAEPNLKNKGSRLTVERAGEANDMRLGRP